MAWSQDDLVMFKDEATGTTTYYFAPTELVLVNVYNRDKNQTVQEAESGRVKVLNLADDDVRWFEFRVVKIPQSARTVGAYSVGGASTIQTMIRTTADYRANLLDLWIGGASKAGAETATVRFWSSSFRIDITPAGATRLFGNGSQTILFREEIA